MIPGLGADKRVFEHLEISGNQMFINWIPPFTDEKIADYSRRLVEANGIENYQVLVGVSFGGIVAGEIGRITQARQVILISSVKNPVELPPLFRMAAKLHLHTLLPYKVLNKPNPLLRFAFGPLSDDEYQVLKQIMKDTDLHFLQWAIKQIFELNPGIAISDTIHIHGTRDRIFHKRYIQNYIPVPGGGHFMIVNRAAEISSIINTLLLKGTV